MFLKENIMSKNHRNFLNSKVSMTLILFVTTFVMLISSSEVYAGTKVNISDNLVYGKNNIYTFTIPQSWDNYVYVERDVTVNKSYIDKLDFYYIPRDYGNKSVKFMSLYTYEKPDYNYDKNEVLTTDDYVFATDNNSIVNPYSSLNDKALFSRFISEAQSDSFISSKINVIDNKAISTNNTLIVNGLKTKNKPITYDNVTYLPVRETAELLGYNVTWVANTKTIVLKKGKTNINIPTQNAKLINKKGTIYLPISTFMKYLDISVNIDANNVITIKG